jgi:hypothetical protein
LVQAFLKKWWAESDFKAPNLPLSLRFKGLNLIENDIVDRLERDPKPCKYFSKQYMLNVKMIPLNIQSKWEKEVHMGIVIEDYNWSCIYCIPFSVTKDT